MRFRRSKAIIAYWQGRELVFENYLTQSAVGADPLTAKVLHLLPEWQGFEDLSRAVPQYSRTSLRKTIQQLIRHSLLVQEGTPAARHEAALEKHWLGWLPHAACLHFATKDVRFLSGAATERMLQQYLAESPQPSFFKSYLQAVGKPIPRPQSPKGAFLPVLTARRTQRTFSRDPVPLSWISDLLYYTWGVAGFIEVPLLGRLPQKTSPSGGARHPIEVYPLILNVQGLAAGLYHYDARRHRLEQLRRGSFREEAVAYCGGQRYVKHAAAVFLMVAVFGRSSWKYRNARAYRVVLLDAGHLCQTFCLTATWLGLAPFSTAALNDSLIERDLGLDGIGESVIYAAGVGMPDLRAGLNKRSRSLASL